MPSFEIKCVFIVRSVSIVHPHVEVLQTPSTSVSGSGCGKIRAFPKRAPSDDQSVSKTSRIAQATDLVHARRINGSETE